MDQLELKENKLVRYGHNETLCQILEVKFGRLRLQNLEQPENVFNAEASQLKEVQEL